MAVFECLSAVCKICLKQRHFALER